MSEFTIMSIDSVTAGNPVSGPIALAVLLTLFAVAVAVHVWLAGREKRLSLRSAASHALAMLWVLPVVGVVALFAGQVGRSLQQDSDREQAVAALADSGSDDRLGVTDRPPGDLGTDVPNWVVTTDIEHGDERLVLSSTFQPVVDDAREALLTETVRRLEADFRRTQPTAGPWRVPPEIVRSRAVAREYVETKHQTVTIARADGPESHSFPVHRVHWQVERSPELRAELQSHMIQPRFRILGSALGLATLILAAVAAYLRLDAWSAGRYRTRLKLAALSLIVAAGLAATAILPM